MGTGIEAANPDELLKGKTAKEGEEPPKVTGAMVTAAIRKAFGEGGITEASAVVRSGMTLAEIQLVADGEAEITGEGGDDPLVFEGEAQKEAKKALKAAAKEAKKEAHDEKHEEKHGDKFPSPKR